MLDILVLSCILFRAPLPHSRILDSQKRKGRKERGREREEGKRGRWVGMDERRKKETGGKGEKGRKRR